MRYATLETAVEAMQELNKRPGHPPAGVYKATDDSGYTVICAWEHHHRPGLLFLLVVIPKPAQPSIAENTDESEPGEPHV